VSASLTRFSKRRSNLELCVLWQAVEYFLETSRMANTNYFHRFVDILRSPMGNPLLAQLAASEGKLKELLAYPSMLTTPVPGAPETAQVAICHSALDLIDGEGAAAH